MKTEKITLKKIDEQQWTRPTDNAKMKVVVLKGKRGIFQEMYADDFQVMRTYSERPYKLGQHCDGTIDDCVHALYIDFCRAIGKDPQEFYLEAYPDKRSDYGKETQEELKRQGEAQGVEYPPTWNRETYGKLLDSLTEINHHSLVGVLMENITI